MPWWAADSATTPMGMLATTQGQTLRLPTPPRPLQQAQRLPPPLSLPPRLLPPGQQQPRLLPPRLPLPAWPRPQPLRPQRWRLRQPSQPQQPVSRRAARRCSVACEAHFRACIRSSADARRRRLDPRGRIDGTGPRCTLGRAEAPWRPCCRARRPSRCRNAHTYGRRAPRPPQPLLRGAAARSPSAGGDGQLPRQRLASARVAVGWSCAACWAACASYPWVAAREHLGWPSLGARWPSQTFAGTPEREGMRGVGMVSPMCVRPRLSCADSRHDAPPCT